jgi:hypothetical protein
MRLRPAGFVPAPPGGEADLGHADEPSEILVIDRGRRDIGRRLVVPAGCPEELGLGLDLGRLFCPPSEDALVFGERA